MSSSRLIVLLSLVFLILATCYMWFSFLFLEQEERLQHAISLRETVDLYVRDQEVVVSPSDRRR